MPLATKNGAIILKDGKLAENCECCGGWYCYGCGEGFKYSPFSGLDCTAFGTVSINGGSTYVSYLNNSDVGCFSVENGSFWQKDSQQLCEAWVVGEDGNQCVKTYIRKQFYFLRPIFGDSVLWDGFAFPLQSSTVAQSSLSLRIELESVNTCDGAGRFASTEVKIKVLSSSMIQVGYVNNQFRTGVVGFNTGFFGDSFYRLTKTGIINVLSSDSSSWPIQFSGRSLSGIASVDTIDSFVATGEGLGSYALDILPPDVPVVISPQLVDSAC